MEINGVEKRIVVADEFYCSYFRIYTILLIDGTIVGIECNAQVRNEIIKWASRAP